MPIPLLVSPSSPLQRHSTSPRSQPQQQPARVRLRAVVAGGRGKAGRRREAEGRGGRRRSGSGGSGSSRRSPVHVLPARSDPGTSADSAVCQGAAPRGSGNANCAGVRAHALHAVRAPPFRFGKDPNLESGEPDEEELDMAAAVVGDDEL
ncbi:unnamed protein product [Closterium sp. Naga37s-1]|nr:unnamed protein product [Closterium sp. Naga37s-1]